MDFHQDMAPFHGVSCILSLHIIYCYANWLKPHAVIAVLRITELILLYCCGIITGFLQVISKDIVLT